MVSQTAPQLEYPVERKPASRMARGVAWGPLLVLPAVVLLAGWDWPGWVLMWSLAFAIYSGCKWLSWWGTPVQGGSAWQHAGYLLAWPGLDAAAFLNPRARPMKPAGGEWLFAAGKLLLGVG